MYYLKVTKVKRAAAKSILATQPSVEEPQTATGDPNLTTNT